MIRKAVIILAIISLGVIAFLFIRQKQHLLVKQENSQAAATGESAKSSEPGTGNAQEIKEAANPTEVINPQDPRFTEAKQKALNTLAPKLRPRAQLKITHSDADRAWAILYIDDAKVELLEARFELDTKTQKFVLAEGDFSLFPGDTPVFKNVPQAQIENSAYLILNTEKYKAEITSPVSKIWHWKPGLFPIPAMEIKIKTPTTFHSGTVLRFDTQTGKLLKKFQSVRH